MTLTDYANRLVNLGPDGEQAFVHVARAITKAELPLRRTNKLLDELWVTMKNTARWQLTSMALHGFMGAIQTAFGYSQDLNKSLNNIRIVSNKSADDMKQFAEQANKAAKALSTTTVDYTDASLIYYQQGLSDEEVIDRTNTTIKMANAVGESARIVSDQLTAVWNNFYDGSKSLEYYADVMTALGAATASSTDEIAEGLEKFAAIASSVGLSYEYATAALATVTATTRQSADVVGTAYKTLFARIQGLQLGETLDDGTTLNKYSKALLQVGINIKDSNGELKQMDDILDEMGDKWNTISKDQQIALAETVAGVRQYTQLVALMDNWDFFQENLQTVAGAEGTLERQAQIYAESWEGARDRVRASAEDIYDSLINPDFFIGLDKAITPVFTVIAKLIDSLGGMPGVLSLVAVAMNKVYGDRIAQSIRDMAANIGIMKGKEAERAKALQQETITIIENLQKTYAANSIESNRLDLLKQEVGLQGIINEEYSKLNAIQKEDLSNKQKNLNLLKQQYEANLENIRALTQSTQTAKTTISFDLKTDNSWRKELEKTINDYNSTKSKKYQIKIPANLEKASSETVFNQLSKQLDSLVEKRSKLKLVSNEFQQLNEKAKDNRETLEKLIKTYDKSIDTSKFKSNQSMREFLQGLGTQANKITLEISAIGKAMVVLGGDSKVVSQMIADFINLGELTEQEKEELRQLKDEIEEIGEATKDGGKGLNRGDDWASTLVKVGTTVSQVSMMINSLNSMFDNLEESVNKGTFSIEDFTTGLASLAMVVPGVTSMFKELNVANIKSAISFIQGATGAMTALQAIEAFLPAIGLATIAIFAIVKVISLFIVTEEEAKERIKAATEAYEQQKSALESLQNELKTTQNRISELNSQNTLTFIEQEELNKLKEQEKSLERQITLQKKLTIEKQKAQAIEIQKDFIKSTQSISNIPIPKLTREMGLGMGNITADVWFETVTKGLDKTSDKYKQYEKTYRDWLEDNKNVMSSWVAENAEAFQMAEDNYEAYINAVLEGAIRLNPVLLQQIQERLAETRKALYGSDAEYYEVYLEPVLDTQAFSQISQELYSALNIGDIELGTNLISEPIKRELMLAGISVDEFLNYLNDRVDNARDRITKKLEITDGEYNKFFNSLTREQKELLLDINIENFKDTDDLKDFLDNYKFNTINVDVTGVDDLKQLLETLNKGQSALETALKSYKDQNGYLTMDQVEELIAVDESYARYIVKVGDAYKLTNEALDDYLDSEKTEKMILDDTLKSINKRYEVNKEYANQYKNMWNELSSTAREAQIDKYFDDEIQKEFFTVTGDYIEKITESYQNGEIEAYQYFDGIHNGINLISDGFSDLTGEIDKNIEKTDLYEAALTAITGQIADGLIDLNKQFKTGSINMDKYYRGTISGAKALIEAYSQINSEKIELGTIIDDDSGQEKKVWQVKEGIKATKKEIEELEATAANLNLWEDQVSKAESMLGLVDTLVAHYDDFIDYTNDVTHMFVLDDDKTFDTTSEKFQQMCTDVGNELKKLEEENQESYKRIVQGILDQGIELEKGLDTSAEELMGSMMEDGTLFEATMNSVMTESSRTITSTSQAAGRVLSALGEMIKNFDFSISFEPTVFEEGGMQWDEFFEGKAKSPIKLPKLGIKISGKAGSSMTDFLSALDEASNYLSSQGTGIGEGGGEDYGNRSGSGRKGTLNPNDIETDNIRDKNSGGGSKDKKGKTYDPEDLKTLKDVEDRYHNINRKIEKQDKLLDNVKDSIDRTYGTDKIKNLSKEISELEKQNLNYQKKIDEAREKYIKKDYEALKEAFKDSPIQLPDMGEELEDYEALLDETLRLYNEFITEYNAQREIWNTWDKIQQEANADEIKAWEDRKKTEDKLFEQRKNAIKQYEDTIKEIEETSEKIEDNLRQIADDKLNQVEYRLEIILDVKSMNDALKEFDKKVAETFGDALASGARFGAERVRSVVTGNIARDMAQEEANLLPEYQKQYDELVALYNSSDQYMNRDQIIADIKELQGKVLDSAEAIVDWVNSIEDMIPEAVNAAKERYGAFLDQLEHNTTVLDTIKELYALQGVTYKTMEGFNRLQKVSQERLNAQVAQAQLQRKWYDEARIRLEQAQAQLDSLNGDETDLRYDTYKKARDAFLAEFNEAEEAYLSLAKDAMETAQQMYLDEIERAVYEFGQAISDGIGLDMLQEKYDHFIEENERYFDKVNEAYQVASWYNKLQTDIDNATNARDKERLRALQEEIDLRAENNTLSQYDLDILEAKYKIMQAQMELEDAKNAKNQLQLVRDSQGNWNYQYTADPNQVDDAQQNALDAGIEYYNIAKKRVEDLNGEIIDLEQEVRDKLQEIAELRLEDETAAAIAEEELKRYYAERMKYLTEEREQALADLQQAGITSSLISAQAAGEDLADIVGENGANILDIVSADNEKFKELVGDNTQLLDLFDNSYGQTLSSMAGNTDNFEAALEDAIDKANNSFENFQDVVSDVADATGTSLEELDEKVNEVAESTDILYDSGSELNDILWDMIDYVMDNVDGYLYLADSIWEAVEAMRALAAEQASFVKSKVNNDKLSYDDDIDYMREITNALLSGDMDAANDNATFRGNKIKDKNINGVVSTDAAFQLNDIANSDSSFSSEAREIQEKVGRGEWNYEDPSVKEKMRKMGVQFATGGYTGEFDGAKLAFLHQKELVLNQEDTANILSAVDMVREMGDVFESIERALDGNGIAALALMNQRLSEPTINMSPQQIEQTIHIDVVEFPNATSSDEIQQAFVSLANDALQYARLRKE